MRRGAQKKLKRYHRQLFFPKWYEDSLEEYFNGVRAVGQITFSLHAVEKAQEYGFEHGRKFIKTMSKAIREDVLREPSVFEFYATGQEIRKACFRVSVPEFPVDLVLVISADGVVVTVFVTNKGDNHDTLNAGLYERSE